MPTFYDFALWSAHESTRYVVVAWESRTANEATASATYDKLQVCGYTSRFAPLAAYAARYVRALRKEKYTKLPCQKRTEVHD